MPLLAVSQNPLQPATLRGLRLHGGRSTHTLTCACPVLSRRPSGVVLVRSGSNLAGGRERSCATLWTTGATSWHASGMLPRGRGRLRPRLRRWSSCVGSASRSTVSVATLPRLARRVRPSLSWSMTRCSNAYSKRSLLVVVRWVTGRGRERDRQHRRRHLRSQWCDVCALRPWRAVRRAHAAGYRPRSGLRVVDGLARGVHRLRRGPGRSAWSQVRDLQPRARG